ncbi:LysR family transcriptional regulator [Marinicrinis lubricantis]|uniref:LysR family transcriptional regulator n=1 Tax=Marinicrinis lubricantis TaxID=2086470 RepID=A0ABW1IUG9_9BACL
MTELELMLYFAAVVDHGSLNKAAKSLNLSQPALSRKMSKLEDSLGVQLFERRGKKLQLTEVGAITYNYALQLQEWERKLQKDLMNYKPSEKTQLLIGASLTTLQSTLPDIIAAFTAQDYKFDIKAATGKTHEIVEMVKDHKVDFGIVASSIVHPELVCVPLFDDHLALLLPASHPLSGSKSIRMKDLDGMGMILFSKGTWYRVLMDELFHGHQVHPDIKMEIDSFEAIIRLIGNSGLATLLPLSYLRRSLLEDNGIVIVDVVELKETSRTTSLIYREDSVFHPEVENRLKSAIRFFQSSGGSFNL